VHEDLDHDISSSPLPTANACVTIFTQGGGLRAMVLAIASLVLYHILSRFVWGGRTPSRYV
jgi:hypothetical protein